MFPWPSSRRGRLVLELDGDGLKLYELTFDWLVAASSIEWAPAPS
jgi:hypothetical protein